MSKPRLVEVVVELGDIKLEVDVLLARAQELLRQAAQSGGAKSVGRARAAVERVLDLEVEALGEIDAKKGTR